jgi:phage baseplate assembly protein gpV
MSGNNAELLKRTIRKVYETMRVAMPAVIESYDPTTSLATVRLSIPHVRDDDEALEVPLISAVPVLWPRAGQASITYPLQRGDWGLVIHCDGDIGKWATELDASKPQSKRRHAWTDAVFLPQTHGLQASSLTGLQLAYGANTVTLTEAGVVVNAPTITLVGNTTVQGNLAVTGTSTLAGIPFGTHRHTGVQTGAGSTGGPI